MRLLVVDNGKLVAARLGQALRALGHEVIIAPSLGQVIEVARHLAIDAVVVDVVLPAMSGVELAEALWLFDRDIPIGFRQCGQDRELIAQAAAVGPLLPARWTPADLERLVADLERRAVRRAEQHRATTPAPSTTRDAWLLVPMRKIVRKINVSCRTWEQVEKLCDQRDAGKDFLTLRGTHELEPEDRLTVALRLPGGLDISIAAQVTSTRREGEERVHVIHLVGFTPQRCAQLRAMVASVRLSVPAVSGMSRVAPMDREPGVDHAPGEERGCSGGAVANAGSMRHQIDSLANKMRPAAATSEQRPPARPPRGGMVTK